MAAPSSRSAKLHKKVFSKSTQAQYQRARHRREAFTPHVLSDVPARRHGCFPCIDPKTVTTGVHWHEQEEDVRDQRGRNYPRRQNVSLSPSCMAGSPCPLHGWRNLDITPTPALRVHRGEAFPQRLEAAVDWAAVTARVELVPFPKPARFGVFPQPASVVSRKFLTKSGPELKRVAR